MYGRLGRWKYRTWVYWFLVLDVCISYSSLSSSSSHYLTLLLLLKVLPNKTNKKIIIHLPFQFSEVYADSANDHLGRMQKESLLKYGRIAVQNGKCMPHSPFCSVVQHLKSGLCRLIVEDSRKHTIRHAVWWDFSVRGISCSPRPLSAQHNKRKRRTSIPSAWLEPAIQTFKRLQTYALDRTVTEIRWHTVTSRKF